MITVEELAKKILNNEDISNIDYSHLTDMSYMFKNQKTLIKMPFIDTKHVISMRGMFLGCTNLLSVAHLYTPEVKTFASMFKDCTSLTYIPPLDTSNATNITSMFENCISIKWTPPLIINSYTNCNSLFKNCISLTHTPKFFPPTSQFSINMFFGCTSLNMDFTHWNFVDTNPFEMFDSIDNTIKHITLPIIKYTYLSHTHTNTFQTKSINSMDTKIFSTFIKNTNYYKNRHASF